MSFNSNPQFHYQQNPNQMLDPNQMTDPNQIPNLSYILNEVTNAVSPNAIMYVTALFVQFLNQMGSNQVSYSSNDINYINSIIDLLGNKTIIISNAMTNQVTPKQLGDHLMNITIIMNWVVKYHDDLQRFQNLLSGVQTGIRTLVTMVPSAVQVGRYTGGRKRSRRRARNM
jgi:hypothetical protein